LIEGLVMGASVILNVVINEGHGATFANRIRGWVMPVRPDVNLKSPERTTRH
jgi:hypothetical protein